MISFQKMQIFWKQDKKWGIFCKNVALLRKVFPTAKNFPQKYPTPLDKARFGVVKYFCNFRVSRKALLYSTAQRRW